MFRKKEFGSLQRSSSPPPNSRGITPPKNGIPDKEAVHNRLFSGTNTSKVPTKTFKKKKKPFVYAHRPTPTVSKRESASSKFFNSSPVKEPATSNEDYLPSRKYNAYKAEADSDSEDDFGAGLISIDKIVSSPVKSSIKAKDSQEIPNIEGLISVSDEDELPKQNKNDVGFAQKLSDGNVMKAMKDHQQSKVEEVTKKFKSYNFPDPIISRKELISRAEKHYHVIANILKGKTAPSIYYELAKSQSSSSSHETMSAAEKWQIKWDKYISGYYGMKRQSLIGSSISVKFKKDLRAAQKRNKTVEYWTSTGFATHVLANEIIIRMAMEDLKCPFEEAENVIQNSVEYGKVVTDSVDVEDDFQAGELLKEEAKEFMKEFSEERSIQKRSASPSETDTSERKKAKPDKLDILAQLVDSDSD
ncbi:RTC4-like domain-containing protein [Scheffersomyces xylosifermentans]|uniref:RTC4-like domain-containing protein n=1 Tax=Scheffersomyces xylosifermentans TaxID=1304137 RepID=UPI00315D1BFA